MITTLFTLATILGFDDNGAVLGHRPGSPYTHFQGLERYSIVEIKRGTNAIKCPFKLYQGEPWVTEPAHHAVLKRTSHDETESGRSTHSLPSCCLYHLLPSLHLLVFRTSVQPHHDRAIGSIYHSEKIGRAHV